MKSFFFKILPIGLLLLISVLSHITWLNPNAVLTNGDLWFLYREGMSNASWGTWTSVLSMGEQNVSYNLFLLTMFLQFIAKLGFNYQVANQIVYFFPVIFIAPIAIYIYLNLMTKNRLASFVGSLVYLYTTFFLMMQNGGLLFTLAYTLLPLQFYFLEKYLRSQKKLYGLAFVLILSWAIFSELRIVYISLFIYIFYILFHFFVHEKQKFIKSLLRFIWYALPFIILLILINAYIYVPLIFSSIKESAGIVTTRALFGVNFFTIREPFVLMHPFWTGKVPSEFIPQPIPFYFWVFPLFAFASLFFAKKEKNIVFFAWVALLMVFLGKSAADPLGEVYTWLYYNFPGFGFFREPSKFWVMLGFSYTVLIAYFIKYGIETITQLKLKKIIVYFLVTIFIFPLIFATFSVAKPTFTAELGPFFNSLAVTKEHYFVKDFIVNQQKFFRTYYIPGRYRMGYWSEINPMLGLNEVPLQFQTLNPMILSLLSVKYVVIPPDITNDVYRIWGSKQIYENQASNASNLKKINNVSFGKFTIYENSLPAKDRIYSPSGMVYVVGNDSDLLHILPLVSTQDPAIYFDSQQKTDNILYDSSSEVIISSSCIRCEGIYSNSSVVFPFANILPQSIFYQFILSREQKNLRVTADPYAKLQLAVFYEVKRMAELQKLNDGQYSSQFAIPVLKEHKRLLDYTQNELNHGINNLSNDSLFYLYDYLHVQAQIGETLLTKRYLDAEGNTLLKNNYEQINGLERIIYSRLWVSDDQSNRYNLSIEKAGDYELFLQSPATEQTVKIDDTDIVFTKSAQDGWVAARSYTFSQGLHKVTTDKPASLISSYPERTELAAEIEKKEIDMPINSIENNSTYSITYSYHASPNIQVHAYLDRDTDYVQNGMIQRTADTYLFPDNKARTFPDVTFQSRFGERKDILKFIITKPKGSIGTLEIHNLHFKKVTPPLFVAKQTKKIVGDTFKSQPKIWYKRINPTKYIAHISDAKDPYYLIFNDSYHGSWSASYGKNQQIAKHFSVNSYANAWYVNKKGNYDITIEFLPQRIFTVSLIISGIAFIFSIVWLILLKLKK